MFLTEKFNLDTDRKVYDWNQFECLKLKNTYKHEYAGEIVSYKLSKEEIEEYFKLSKLEKEKFLIQRGK